MLEKIIHFNPCPEARAWLKQQQNPLQAWYACPEPVWMLWLLATTIKSEPWSEDRKPLVNCCIEIVGHFEPKSHNLDGLIESLREWNPGVADRIEDYPNRDYVEAVAVCVSIASIEPRFMSGYISDLLVDPNNYSNYDQLPDIIRKHFPRPPYGD